jgi:hypothetical protein
MTATYSTIATNTLGSAAASVTFSSLGSYTDLVLVCTIQTQSTNDAVTVRFNGDSGTNYSFTQLRGNASGSTSNRTANATMARIANDMPSSTNYGTSITHIQNYSNSTTNKTFISRFGNALVATGIFAGLWRSTAAITSITIYPEVLNTILTGSTFTLYGIKAE